MPQLCTSLDLSGRSNIIVGVGLTGARNASATPNWFVASHFTLMLEGDYHAVGKFEHQDAVTSKPSGLGLTLGFGFGWGGKG